MMMTFEFTATCKKTIEELNIQADKSYRILTCDFKNYMVKTDPDNKPNTIDTSTLTDAFDTDPGIDVPYELLSKNAADKIYRKEWYHHVCEDVGALMEKYEYPVSSKTMSEYCQKNDIKPTGEQPDQSFITTASDGNNIYAAITNDDMESIIDLVATRYVYDGDYDCNMDYWSQLRQLIEGEIPRVL